MVVVWRPKGIVGQYCIFEEKRVTDGHPQEKKNKRATEGHP